MQGAPDAGDPSFWDALGIPPEMRDGIVQSAGVTEIWPENLPAFDLFSSVLTQWRVGMAGPTGLDYAALPAVMDMLGCTNRRELFADLQVMESEALRCFSDGRQQHENRTHRAG